MSLLFATHALMTDDYQVAPVIPEAVPSVPAQNQNSMATLAAAMANVQGGPVVKR